MPLLPPTVGERLARCEQAVEAWGIVPGATVVLLIDGAVAASETSPGSYHVFNLGAGLNAGQSVKVRQTVATETSPDSPPVVVGDVEFPIPPPHLAPALLRCAHCLYADGMAPGSKVTMFTANEQRGRRPLGSGSVNRFGYACFDPGFIDDGPVFGIATTCGTDSAASPRSFLVPPPAHFPRRTCTTRSLAARALVISTRSPRARPSRSSPAAPHWARSATAGTRCTSICRAG